MEWKDIGVIVTVPSQADLKAICDSAVLYVDGKEYKGSSASSTTEATEAKEETKPKEKTEPESGTPVDNHGKLTLKGTDIVDKNGDKYQLKGVSTHGIAWFPEYVNQDAFQSLRDDMGANLIRIAMYSGENNGYCTGGDQKQLKELVKTGVDAATNLGMYVIIDWHVLGDQNPQTYKEEAKAFFEEMSSLYKDYDNVIYEICNEPNGGTTWADVKSYAEEVIPIIRKNTKDALIIVGTPTWSQDVDIAAEDPVTGYDNIMYAELNTKSDYCQVCGYDGEIKIVEDDGKLVWECPQCGNRNQDKMNVARRTCGYIGTQFWNQGRTQEIKERVLHL